MSVWLSHEKLIKFQISSTTNVYSYDVYVVNINNITFVYELRQTKWNKNSSQHLALEI